MRIYNRVKIDAQRRVNLSGFYEPGDKVVIYTEYGDDVIFVETYDETNILTPDCALRKVDAKGRVALPKWVVKGYNVVDISTEYVKWSETVRRTILLPDTV